MNQTKIFGDCKITFHFGNKQSLISYLCFPHKLKLNENCNHDSQQKLRSVKSSAKDYFLHPTLLKFISSVPKNNAHKDEEKFSITCCIFGKMSSSQKISVYKFRACTSEVIQETIIRAEPKL